MSSPIEKCFAQHASQKVDDGKCDLRLHLHGDVDVNLHELSSLVSLPGQIEARKFSSEKDHISAGLDIKGVHECFELYKCIQEQQSRAQRLPNNIAQIEPRPGGTA